MDLMGTSLLLRWIYGCHTIDLPILDPPAKVNLLPACHEEKSKNVRFD